MYYRYNDGVENIYEKIKKYKMIEENRKRKKTNKKIEDEKIDAYIKSITPVYNIKDLLNKWKEYKQKYERDTKRLYFYDKVKVKDLLIIKKDIKKLNISDLIILENRYLLIG